MNLAVLLVRRSVLSGALGDRVFLPDPFYRTGRRGPVIHSTARHVDSQKPSSDGTGWTQEYTPTPLESEFKSTSPTESLARRGCRWPGKDFPTGLGLDVRRSAGRISARHHLRIVEAHTAGPALHERIARCQRGLYEWWRASGWETER